MINILDIQSVFKPGEDELRWQEIINRLGARTGRTIRTTTFLQALTRAGVDLDACPTLPYVSPNGAEGLAKHLTRRQLEESVPLPRRVPGAKPTLQGGPVMIFIDRETKQAVVKRAQEQNVPLRELYLELIKKGLKS